MEKYLKIKVYFTKTFHTILWMNVHNLNSKELQKTTTNFIHSIKKELGNYIVDLKTEIVYLDKLPEHHEEIIIKKHIE